MNADPRRCIATPCRPSDDMPSRCSAVTGLVERTLCKLVLNLGDRREVVAHIGQSVNAQSLGVLHEAAGVVRHRGGRCPRHGGLRWRMVAVCRVARRDRGTGGYKGKSECQSEGESLQGLCLHRAKRK